MLFVFTEIPDKLIHMQYDMGREITLLLYGYIHLINCTRNIYAMVHEVTAIFMTVTKRRQ